MNDQTMSQTQEELYLQAEVAVRDELLSDAYETLKVMGLESKRLGYQIFALKEEVERLEKELTPQMITEDVDSEQG